MFSFRISLFSFVLINIVSASFVAWFRTTHEGKELINEEIEYLAELKAEAIDGKRIAASIKEDFSKVLEIGKNLQKNLKNSTVHPIEHFRILHKYDRAWKKIQNIPEMELYEIPSDLSDRFPTEIDHDVVRQSLLNNQNMFGLKTDDLVRGIVVKSISAGLSVDECVKIGLKAETSGDIDLCISWLTESISKIKLGEISEYTESDIKNVLDDCQDKNVYKHLCGRGVGYIPEAATSGLQCLMWTNFRHPYLVIQPVKMEVHSKVPMIVRFYDVISEKEMTLLKAIAEPYLGRAETYADINSLKNINLDSARVGYAHFLEDDISDYENTPNFDEKLLTRLTHRIGCITGSSMGLTELYQVAMYGIGGHYTVHSDAGEDVMRKSTFMLYVSDVEYGGATVFVRPQIAIAPVKGSAVFWYNILPSEEVDYRVRHAGCPVLNGVKWIVNKWIYDTDNDICMDWNLDARI